MAGRQSQQKNRIWQDRSGTQSLAAAGGAFITCKLHMSFGKACGHIELLEVGEILHMGCYGREFGPGQLSTARRTRLKREKRGGFPPLLLNTMHFTPDIVANSRGVLKHSLNGVCPFHFSSQILSLTHSACSDCLFCSVLKFYNIFIILSWHLKTPP